MTHHASWWAAVTANPCPVCTAGPGEPCVSYSNHVKGEPHADRARLASANGWREPEDVTEPDEGAAR